VDEDAVTLHLPIMQGPHLGIIPLLLLLVLPPSHLSQQQSCNGHPELCNRAFSAVSYVTTHNSFAVGKSPACNQNNPILTQLNDGVRALMLQIHIQDPTNHVFGAVELCHTSCALLDAGPLNTALTQIRTWLDAHPNEVITLFMHNQDNFGMSELIIPFQQAGLIPMIYYKSPQAAWPTLAQMISVGQRVVVLVDVNTDTTNYPMLMNEFTVAWETPYNYPVNSEFPCNQDRPTGPLDIPFSSAMSVANHFPWTLFAVAGTAIPIPNPDFATQVNSLSALQSHIQTCAGLGVRVTYMAVDFYEYGSVFQVVAQLNGVTYTGHPTIPSAATVARTVHQAVIWTVVALLLYRLF